MKSTYQIIKQLLSLQFFNSLNTERWRLRMINKLLRGSKNMALHSTNNLDDTAVDNSLQFLYLSNKWHQVSYSILKRKDQCLNKVAWEAFHCVHHMLLHSNTTRFLDIESTVAILSSLRVKIFLSQWIIVPSFESTPPSS
jgi:hypothetical protein